MIKLYSFDNMDGIGFEKWCAKLLYQTGYTGIKFTPVSGDQGVDIVAVKEGVRYAIQCKCYVGTVGNSAIQQVYAGKEIYKCHVGVVMTNSYFSPGAQELAKSTNTLLWDREKIIEMAKQSKGESLLEPVSFPIINNTDGSYMPPNMGDLNDRLNDRYKFKCAKCGAMLLTSQQKCYICGSNEIINNNSKDEKREETIAADTIPQIRNNKKVSILIAFIVFIFLAIVLIILHGIGASPYTYLFTFYIIGVLFLLEYVRNHSPQSINLILLIAVVVLFFIIGQYK